MTCDLCGTNDYYHTYTLHELSSPDITVCYGCIAKEEFQRDAVLSWYKIASKLIRRCELVVGPVVVGPYETIAKAEDARRDLAQRMPIDIPVTIRERQ